MMKRFFQSLSVGHGSSNQAGSSDQDSGIPKVYSEPYFYGRITRQEAEDILAGFSSEDGVFLLRESITPMGNFSLTMQNNNQVNHYSIEKQIDGQYMIPLGTKFPDPVELIEYYQRGNKGLVTSPKFPCVRQAGVEPIAFRGLTYPDLHGRMKDMARTMNASMQKAMGPMRESLLLRVVCTIHIEMPWFHGEIIREEAMRRLEHSGHEDGKFLIRSKTDDGVESFVLTLSAENVYRHYVIKKDHDCYSMQGGVRFKALIILVDHYHNKRDGLPCKLKIPVCNPDCQIKTWERYKQNSIHLSQILCQPRSLARPVHSELEVPSRRPPPIPGSRENGRANLDQGAVGGREDFADPFPEEEPEGVITVVTQTDADQLEEIYSNIRMEIMSKELRPDQIQLEEANLGSGQFGFVKKGLCKLNGKNIPVAVKTLKNNNPEGEKEIMSEATLMKELDHQHIVRMIGICTGENLMLVMELAEVGPLKKYLDRHKDMKAWHSVELMTQICDGMIYLESKDIVHRDLATRNVLLMTDHFAKISDFGLSRMINNYSVYYTAHQPGRWPLMWYAPECIHYHKFDSKSDVWSFGVTMWEIMSHGLRPYSKQKLEEIVIFVDSGKRMSKPKDCDDNLYNVMLDCWEKKKEQRPSFREIKPVLEKLYREYKHSNR